MAPGLCCNFQEETCWRQPSEDRNNAGLNYGFAKTSYTGARGDGLCSALKQGKVPGTSAPEDMPQTCLPRASSKATELHNWFHRGSLLSSRDRNLLPLHIHVKVALHIPVHFFSKHCTEGISVLPDETLNLLQCLTCSPSLPTSLPPR